MRKRYVTLTPEEWVRQHFVQYLVNQLGYRASLIAIEQPLKYNQRNKRSDIVVYNTSGQAVAVVECKAPTVPIDQKVFDQAAMYNMTLKVPILMVTNGLQHYCCKINHEARSYAFLQEVPNFSELDFKE